jgi:hypothetical protein
VVLGFLFLEREILIVFSKPCLCGSEGNDKGNFFGKACSCSITLLYLHF